MKITKQQLRKIIKEELKEAYVDVIQSPIMRETSPETGKEAPTLFTKLMLWTWPLILKSEDLP